MTKAPESIVRMKREKIVFHYIQVALLFLFFHRRLCGPLANSWFHHQPDPTHRPNSKLKLRITRPMPRFSRSSICSPQLEVTASKC